MPHLSPLESLPLNVFSSIALYAAENSFLGPPVDLLALSLTSRTLRNTLALSTNTHFWGELFEFKFDKAAVSRRLGDRWTTSGCLAQEANKRYAAMSRIRRGIVVGEHHKDDLWTAYLMMLESDGKNERQLIEWANIRRYLYIAIFYRARAPRGHSCSWFSDAEGTSLVLWLEWMTACPAAIRNEPPQLQQQIRALIHPFIVAGYRYPSLSTPDSQFHLPLCAFQNVAAPHTSGPLPHVAKILHYNHELNIAAPPLTSAAFLVATVRLEAVQDVSPLSGEVLRLPANREIADAQGLTGRTLEDVQNFQYRVRTPFLKPCPVDQEAAADSDEPLIDSARHDSDWYRLVSCYDLWDGPRNLGGVVYTPGTLSGLWDGRSFIPHISSYWTMVINPATDPASVGMSLDRVQFEFREHHCIYPDEPLIAGTDESGYGDDILNAFLPEDAEFRDVEDGVEVHVGDSRTRYYTYHPDRALPYSKEGCSKLQMVEPTWTSDDLKEESDMAESVTEGALEAGDVPNIDDDDEYENTVEHLSSGIKDILITGKTTTQQGAAWGHYTLVGRIRPWDGLCVLLRSPAPPSDVTLGRWIFKGYINDGRFVGRCRDTSTDAAHVGWEGSFVLSRVNANEDQ